MSEEKSELYLAIVDGDFDIAGEETQALVDAGVSPTEILDNHVIPAMDEVGELFEEGEYFVPELLMAAKAAQESMAILNPSLRQSGVERQGVVVIGTVKGDMHDVGKNLVAATLEGAGFEVVDLGCNVAPEAFAEEVKKHSGEKIIVCMSALLTTTMAQMKTTIDLLVKEGLRDKVKTLVGGAPVTQAFATQIGADGYSENANECVALAREIAASWKI
ncbi:MAG: corrinoid protein [Thermoguttaceae bacterium]|jgi:5-methyltetrahydrofolate--homocysteine methyltransferase